MKLCPGHRGLTGGGRWLRGQKHATDNRKQAVCGSDDGSEPREVQWDSLAVPWFGGPWGRLDQGCDRMTVMFQGLTSSLSI